MFVYFLWNDTLIKAYIIVKCAHCDSQAASLPYSVMNSHIRVPFEHIALSNGCWYIDYSYCSGYIYWLYLLPVQIDSYNMLMIAIE